MKRLTEHPGKMENHKVIIVGADSLIGSELERALDRYGYNVTGTSRRIGKKRKRRIYLDIANSDTYEILNEKRYSVAILCGAITSLQECELNPENSRNINVTGTKEVAKRLSKNGAFLIFLSTNLVYDGKSTQYSPEDPQNPMCEYGRQKKEIEEWIRDCIKRAAIVRFGKVLQKNYPLFMEWKNRLEEGKTINPYENKTIAPISLESAIKILCWLIQEKKRGIYHATATKDIAYSEAAYRIAELCGADRELVKPTDHQESTIKRGEKNQKGISNTLKISPSIKHLIKRMDPFFAIDESIRG